jgi:hypothetical protein
MDPGAGIFQNGEAVLERVGVVLPSDTHRICANANNRIEVPAGPGIRSPAGNSRCIGMDDHWYSLKVLIKSLGVPPREDIFQRN